MKVEWIRGRRKRQKKKRTKEETKESEEVGRLYFDKIFCDLALTFTNTAFCLQSVYIGFTYNSNNKQRLLP
jgi:hypothetical protein